MEDAGTKLADALRKFGFQNALKPETDLSEIAQCISSALSAYIDFRKSDRWERQEKYKWAVVESRSEYSLSEEFFKCAPNLCSGLYNCAFLPKENWNTEGLLQHLIDALKQVPNDDYRTKLTKAKEFINSHTNDKKNKLQSEAYLLFYLQPDFFFPYFWTSLVTVGNRWNLKKEYCCDACYLDWIELANNVLLPAFKEYLSSSDSSVMRIPLDIQDMIHFLYWMIKNNHDSQDFSIWKISEGTGYFSPEEYHKTLRQKIIVMDKNTKSKGRAKDTQGELFLSDERVGDIVYICRGNQEISLLALISEQEPVQYDDTWYSRKIIPIKAATDNAGYKGNFSAWWLPNDNSTFIEVSNLEMFEKEILIPFFDMTYAALLEERNIILHGKEIAMRKMIDLLLQNKQLILTGAPGTGKTYKAEQIAAALILPDEENQHKMLQEALKAVAKGTASPDQEKIGDHYEFVQFHSGYDYSDFVQGLKPAVKQGQVIFELKDGLFMNFCKKAAKNPGEKYVFVIDEINRADLSRVFGELFFGLEEDYRGKPIKTQYSYLSEKPFIIPPNVYIIGTMNDIDRSVESMDFALRRRFAWCEITAKESMSILDSISLKDDNGAEIKLTNLAEIIESAKQKMEAVNSYIGSWEDDPVKALPDGLSLNLGKEYQLGGAYFKKIAKYIEVEEKDGKPVGTPDWNSLWKNHIAVILREYLRGRKDAEKILIELKKKYDNPEAAPKTEDQPSVENKK